MLFVLYVLLAVVTTIYLFMSARMDLKERQIYTMPCFLLTLSWCVYLLDMQVFDWRHLVLYWFFHHVLWRLFNHFKVWGAGDSDVFLLLCNVLLAVLGAKSWVVILIAECVCVITALASAILVAVLEFRQKEKGIDLYSKVAVVPGFAIVIIALLIFGLLGRMV